MTTERLLPRGQNPRIKDSVKASLARLGWPGLACLCDNAAAAPRAAVELVVFVALAAGSAGGSREALLLPDDVSIVRAE